MIGYIFLSCEMRKAAPPRGVMLLCALLDQNGALYGVRSSFHFHSSCREMSASGVRTRTYSSSRSSTADISASGCPATPNTG